MKWLKPVGRFARRMKGKVDKLFFPKWSRRIARDGFDARHGTDTATLCEARNNNGQLVHRYETAHVLAIEAALDCLRLDFTGFAFIDMGCGKGKPLLLAAKRPFARVIGVDIDQRSLDIAARNRDLLGLTPRIELEFADATRYEFPPLPLVIYLFNPFPGVVVQVVVDRLIESLRTHPRPVAVIYLNPRHTDLFVATGVFREVGQANGVIADHERSIALMNDLAAERRQS